MGLITSKQHPKLHPTSSPITWVSKYLKFHLGHWSYLQQELVADLMDTRISTLKDEILKRIEGDSYVMGEIEA